MKGVPLQNGKRAEILEPKKSGAFRVLFDIEEPHAENLTAQVKSVSRPHYQTQFGEGLGIWAGDPSSYISVEIYDDLLNNGSQAVNKLLESPFTISIEMLDGAGFVLERISLSGCLIEEINYTPLDYASHDPCMINFTVKGTEKVQEFFAPNK